ncbi:hypothetical protein [Hymenobacter jeollabukensis]|uniref:Uncharacterized protein n=1 Tax=Hymenobacter jeollabukensis TaxID=2025313 RepID=A0A5R8WPM0_9BACT|nr:hypothetical protein [Hymenobacter jeollabukensis]TLM92244.1 hypothetical protein FDY95_12450 [Hymenobacter jeollabukensis]
MLRTAFCTAALAVIALTAQAQKGLKSTVQAGKAVDTSGKAVIPVGPVLAGEEKLSAQERAERTFLMPPRKKMPSVQPAPPHPDPTSGAVAIGPPTVAEMAAEEAAKAEAAKPATTTHRSSARRHRSSASHRSSRKKTVTKKKTSSSKKKSSARRRR